MEKIPNTVLLCQHGSHLYGTDTPNSDRDYKGIYRAPLSDIILGHDKETILYNTKPLGSDRRNTSDDIDYQYKELRRFIKDALSGQVYAIDLLFAPRSMWLSYSSIWLNIINNRERLLSSNIKPFIGYALQQAAKYGLKGSRLAEVIRFRDWLLTYDNSIKVGTVFHNYSASDHVNLLTVKDATGKPVSYIRVLQKQYQLNQKAGDLATTLSVWIDKYGTRSVDAMQNKGVDFKAVSHAFRCVYQVKELLTTGHLEMPLRSAFFLKKIKLGEFDFPYLRDLLANEIDEIKAIKSILPEEPDHEFWDKRLIEYYTEWPTGLNP